MMSASWVITMYAIYNLFSTTHTLMTINSLQSYEINQPMMMNEL